MKLYLKPLLSAIKPGYKTVAEFVEKRKEPLTLDIDNSYSIYFYPQGENMELSLYFRGIPATEPAHGNGLFIHVDPILVPTKGIEDLVTDIQTQASQAKRDGKVPSYPKEVWRLLEEKRIRK